ncbi:MAG: AAA family ATPase [Waddliaceae bacterium]|nr:AAA family ATPase [Waddliaceae bacterium]
MAHSETEEFTGLRSYLWPIHMHELRKLIPMLCIFFLICFNYSILKNLKDAIVVNARGSGAEVIPFLKVWAMLPFAVFLTYALSKLGRIMSQEKVFYCVVIFFLTYFLLFITLLYPNRDWIHPHATADYITKLTPDGMAGLIAVARNWSFSIFYALSELWAAIVLSVLFWGFANNITKVCEAKRFYSVFGIGANLAAVAGAQAALYLTFEESVPFLPSAHDAWEQTIIALCSVVIVIGFAIIAIYRWLHVNVVYPEELSTPSSPSSKKKNQGSLSESFRLLLSSKYLICLAVLVLGYNLCINLVEVLWKDQLRQLYPTGAQYNIYMNKLTSVMGVISTFTAVFISGNAIRRLGWTFTAMLTPVIMLITTLGFFGFLLFGPSMAVLFPVLDGLSPLVVVVFFGAAHNAFSKAAKYTVFDNTKEMAFIPLDPEQKLHGKAAIDGVISRMGKSGGSLIHQIFLFVFASFTMSAPYIAIITITSIVCWILAVRVLSKEFKALSSAPSTSNVNNSEKNSEVLATS